MRKIRNILVVSFCFFPALGWTEDKQEIVVCESTKEFVTAFEFLRSDSEMGLSGDIALKTASEVAKGCSGAAKRFIQTVRSLRKTELGMQDVLITAQEIAKKDDAIADAFNSIFRKLYAQDGYDLDLRTAVDLAKSLSVDFVGNVRVALEDFDKISNFCSSTKSLDLPVRQCAELAQRIAVLGGRHEQSVNEKFVESFNYFTKSTGLGFTIKEALELSEDLMQKHPLAFGNFKQAYEYAISPRGLNADRTNAVAFGKKMANATTKESKTE